VDYSATLRRGWDITWQNKWLFLLTLLPLAISLISLPLSLLSGTVDPTAAPAEVVASAGRSLLLACVSMILSLFAALLTLVTHAARAAGVARAALESLAENTSDGITAPLFWGVVAGLPGIAAYKAINTLDSMIGHRTPRHEAFGWAAARIDDIANLLPARLTGLIFALVSGRPRAALACMGRDARHHRSPNAGWPEAAMAGALGRRLSGPRIYGERVAEEPWVNGAAPDPGPGDLGRGLALYRRAMWALAALIGALALAGV